MYVEKLQVKNMSASARGTMEEPGRCVRAKSGLNRSILDQGWYTFRRQLDYKIAWKGGELVEVDCRHTSQRCSVCGYTARENRPAQTLFRCMVCGHEENADVNAAKNITTAGRAGLACDANYKGSRQQNPFRARVSKPARICEENLPLLCT